MASGHANAVTEKGLAFGEAQSMNGTSAGNVHVRWGAAGDQDLISLVFDKETDGNDTPALQAIGNVVFREGSIPRYAP